MKSTETYISINLSVSGLGDLSKIVKELKKLPAIAKKSDDGFKGLSRSLIIYQSNLFKINKLQKEQIKIKKEMVGLIKSTALEASTKIAMDYQSAIAGLAKTINFTNKEEQKAFSEQIQLFSRNMSLTAEQLVDIAKIGANGGIDTKDLLAFTKSSGEASMAFGIDIQNMAAKLSNLSHTFGSSANEMDYFPKMVANLSKEVGVSAGGIIDVMNAIGASAKEFGLTQGETAALSASMLKFGKTQEKTVETIHNLIFSMQNAENKGKSFQDVLQKMGMDTDYLAGGVGEYQKALQVLKDTEGAEVAMQERLQIERETASYQLKIAKNALSEAGNVIGTLLLPVLTIALKAFTAIVHPIVDFIRNNEFLVKTVLYTVVALRAFKIANLALRFAFNFVKIMVLELINSFISFIAVIRTIGTKFMQFGRTLLRIASLVKTGVIGFIKTLIQFGAAVGRKIGSFVSYVGTKFMQFGRIFLKAANSVKTWLLRFIRPFVQFGAAIGRGIGSLVSTIGAKLIRFSGIFLKMARFVRVGAFIVSRAIMAIPFGWVAVSVIAGVAAIAWLSDKFGGFGNLVSWVWEKIKLILKWSPFGVISQAWDAVFEWLGSKFEWVQNSIDAMSGWVTKAADKIKGAFNSVSSFFGFGEEDDVSTQTYKTYSMEEKAPLYNYSQTKEELSPSYGYYQAPQAVMQSSGNVNINFSGNFLIGTNQNGQFDLQEFKTQIVRAVKDALNKDTRDANNRRIVE